MAPVAAPAVSTPAAAHAPAAADSLNGRWTLDRAASGDVRRAIDTTTARMNFVVRRVARGRLRGANEVHEHLTLAITPTEVSTQVDRGAPIVSPADGRSVTWTRENGDVFQLHTQLQTASGGQQLVQTFVGRDGSSRENVFATAGDGRTLSIAVTVAHPRLPHPVVYRLVYRRD